MGVAPLHWELRIFFPDFMILPQNSLNYHKKSSDTLGNEVHTQQQPATREIAQNHLENTGSSKSASLIN